MNMMGQFLEIIKEKTNVRQVWPNSGLNAQGIGPRKGVDSLQVPGLTVIHSSNPRDYKFEANFGNMLTRSLLL